MPKPDAHLIHTVLLTAAMHARGMAGDCSIALSQLKGDTPDWQRRWRPFILALARIEAQASHDAEWLATLARDWQRTRDEEVKGG